MNRLLLIDEMTTVEVADRLRAGATTVTRSGYSHVILGQDLPARWHLLRVALPAAGDPALRFNGPVLLAWLLVAGGTNASRQPSPQGAFIEKALVTLRFDPIPVANGSWAGPYPVDSPGARDGRLGLETAFAPERPGVADIEWKPFPTDEPVLDVSAMTGNLAPAVAYARAGIDSANARNAILNLTVDYYAKVWLNGELVSIIDHNHGASASPVTIPIRLKAGANELLVKVASGSKGHSVRVAVSRENENTSDTSTR